MVSGDRRRGCLRPLTRNSMHVREDSNESLPRDMRDLLVQHADLLL